MEIKRVPISEVEVWDKNPRNIKIKDFLRLKKQIVELGVYKPLICFQENGKFVTLGGNMRLKALQALKIEEVDISIVKAETEALKIKYALSDNDRAGEYEEQKLAELVYPHIEEIDLEEYKLDLGDAISLKDMLENYGPVLDGDKGPEVEFSEEVLLEHNYVILYFDNSFDWEAAKEKFKLKRVRDLIPRKGQPVGIGRVINGKEWLKKIHD